jgi:serine acetyltransferase
MKPLQQGIDCIIGKNVQLGKNVRLGHRVIIEDDAKIGDDVYIDSNTIIRGGSCWQCFDRRCGLHPWRASDGLVSGPSIS